MKLYIILVYCEDAPTIEYEVEARTQEDALRRLRQARITVNRYFIMEV